MRYLLATLILTTMLTTASADTIMLDAINAQPVVEPTSKEPLVNVMLSKQSGDEFLKFTAARINRVITIDVDGEVLAQPTIRSPVGRHIQLSGEFDTKAATDLAARLRAGAKIKVSD